MTNQELDNADTISYPELAILVSHLDIDDIMHPGRDAREGLSRCDAQMKRLDEELAKAEAMTADERARFALERDPELRQRIESFEAAGKSDDDSDLCDCGRPESECHGCRCGRCGEFFGGVSCHDGCGSYPRPVLLVSDECGCRDCVAGNPELCPYVDVSNWSEDEAVAEPWQRPADVWDRGTGEAHENRVRDLAEDPGGDGGIGDELIRQRFLAGGRDAIMSSEARQLAETMGADAPAGLVDFDTEVRHEQRAEEEVEMQDREEWEARHGHEADLDAMPVRS